MTLLACPFCGSERLENLDAARDGYSPVHCIDCGARGPMPERLERMGLEFDGLCAWNVRNGEFRL